MGIETNEILCNVRDRAIAPATTCSRRVTRAVRAVSRVGTPNGVDVNVKVDVPNAAAACVLACATTMFAPVDVARAFSGEIELTNVRYTKVECPANQYVPNKLKTLCLRFDAQADNRVKGRSIDAANVFGFVDDVEGNSAATVNADGNSRTVLSSIDGPIPEGKSDVSFVVTVFKDSYEKGPLKLKAFKAMGSVADIDKRFKPFDACEVDPDSCL